ncbi:MAG: peptidylprolyl isomerase [Candidatus Doudnabacteria bacterium]
MQEEKQKNEPAEDIKKKTRYGKKVFLWITGGGFVILVLGSLVVLGLGIYKYPWQSKGFSENKEGWQQKILSTVITSFPFPIAATNIEQYDFLNPQGIFAFRFIPIKNWEANVEALKKYYEKEGMDFTTSDGQEQLKNLQSAVLEKMIMDKIVAGLAKEKNIVIEDKDVETELKQAETTFGGPEEIAKMVQEMYGWSMDDFKQQVIVPYLEQKKLLENVFNADQENEQAKKKALEVLAKVKAENANFEDLAREYSEDPSSSEQGGDLGTFGRGAMMPAFEDAAFALNKRETSDLIQTEYGYHIIKVEDKGKLDTGEEQVHARHILIRTTDPTEWFQKWLEEQKAKMKIYKFIDLGSVQ